LFLTLQSFGCSLQAIVYFSVRVEKENLNHIVLLTELFGTDASDNEATYVSVDEAGKAESVSRPLPDDGKDIV